MYNTGARKNGSAAHRTRGTLLTVEDDDIARLCDDCLRLEYLARVGGLVGPNQDLNARGIGERGSELGVGNT